MGVCRWGNMKKIHDVVGEVMHQWTFTVIGNTVRVFHQDYITRIENHLKRSGVTGVKVVYWDGKQEVPITELKSFLVTGNCDKGHLFGSLDKLYTQYKFTKLIYPAPWPLMPFETLLTEWAKKTGVEEKPVEMKWKGGWSLPACRRGIIKGKRPKRPDVLVAFTNKEETQDVKDANKRGIEVIFA